MPVLSKDLFERLVDLFAARLQTRDTRREYVNAAFVEYAEVVSKIELEGNPLEFSERIVRVLASEGVLPSCKHALRVFGEQFMPDMGLDEQTHLEGLLRLVDELLEQDDSTDVVVGEVRNPYKGLRSFAAADRKDFFGRTVLIQKLCQMLQSRLEEKQPPLLALLGPSGSGKSSVILAGVIPALKEDVISGSRNWLYLNDEIIDQVSVFKTFRTGTSPLDGLTALLQKALPQQTLAQVREAMTQREGLVTLTRMLVQNRRALLFIDQFEDLFKSDVLEVERSQFLAQLTEGLRARSDLTVILTMRADFYDRVLQYPDLAALFNSHAQILPMTLTELYEAVREPARQVGLSFEPGLIEKLVFEVHEEPGALPLLQFALDQLYQKRQGLRLTLDAYNEMGGVKGALARRAEAFYATLTQEQESGLRRILLRLVIVGDDTEPEKITRRRVEAAELQFAGLNQIAVQTVLDRLTDERLLVTSTTTRQFNGTQTRQVYYEVSHEALLTHWGRLVDWITESQADLRLYNDILALALDWANTERTETSYLLTGKRLATARDWCDRFDPAPLQSDFIQASADHEEAEIARLERLTREAKDAVHDARIASKRAQRNRAIALAVGSIALVIILFTGLFTTTRVNEAQQQVETAKQNLGNAATSIAEANVTLTTIPVTMTFVANQVQQAQTHVEALRLAGLASDELLAQRPHTAILLAIRALRTLRTQQTDLVLGQALRENLGVRQLFGHTDTVISAVYSSDGRFIITSSLDGTTIIWDALTGKLLHTLREDGVPIVALSYSSDSQTLLTGFGERIQLWAMGSGERLLTVKGLPGSTLSAVYSPDASAIATWGGDSTIVVWNTRTGNPLYTLRAEGGQIQSVAFTPDSQWIAGSRDDGSITLWDMESGIFVRSMHASAEPTNAMIFSPDGRLLAGSSARGAITLWDTATSVALYTLGAQTGRLESPIFSPDGHILFTGHQAEGLVWSTANGQLLYTLPDYIRDFFPVVFSPNGKFLVTGGYDATAVVWDTTTGEPLHTLSNRLSRVVFSPDGQFIATGSNDGTAVVWNITTEQPIYTLQGHTGSIESIAYSPDGQFLVTGSRDKTAIIWNTRFQEPFETLSGHTAAVTTIAYSVDGQRLLTGGEDGTAILWDNVNHRQTQIFQAGTGNIRTMAFSPDQHFIVIGTEDGTAVLWDTLTGKILQTLELTAPVFYAQFSPDSHTLVTSTYFGPVMIYEVPTGRLLHILDGHKSRVNSIIYSPDGRLIATGSEDQTAILWDTHTGQSAHTLKSHTGDVLNMAFSPDGQFLVTGSLDSTAIVWDTGSGKQLYTLQATASVTTTAYSHEGRFIATGSQNGTVQVWEAATGKPVFDLSGHTTRVINVQFSSDDQLIVTGSSDGTTIIWDVLRGQALHTILGQPSPTMAISPVGYQAVQVTDSGGLLILDVNPDTFLDRACQQIQYLRDFTDEERRRFGIIDDDPTCPERSSPMTSS